MDGRIIHAIQNTPGMELEAGVESSAHPILEKGIAQYAGIPELTAPMVSDLGEVIDQADVIIDFTAPEASIVHLQVAKVKKTALVVGKTGFDEDQRGGFVEAGRVIAVCLSPNVGMNLLFSLVGQVARILGQGYDPEIVEIPHRLKKDATSGTTVKGFMKNSMKI